MSVAALHKDQTQCAYCGSDTSLLSCSKTSATATAPDEAKLDEPAMDLSATFRQSMRLNLHGEHQNWKHYPAYSWEALSTAIEDDSSQKSAYWQINP